MSENEAEQQTQDESQRKRLLNRIAVAGVIIVGLLAGLAAFDALMAPAPQKQAKDEEPEAPILNRPTAIAPEAKPAELPPAPPAESAKESAPPVVAEQTEAPQPAQLPEPKAERPLTKPATARPAIMRPTPAPAPVQAPPPAEAAAPPAAAPGRIARAVAAAKHYMLQLGVFSNPVNAEELRARLVQNGIPAEIQSRVEVGPFASRKEAEETRQKLISLGIEPGIVVSIRK